jgi:hypothetical protein
LPAIELAQASSPFVPFHRVNDIQKRVPRFGSFGIVVLAGFVFGHNSDNNDVTQQLSTPLRYIELKPTHG